MTNRQDLHAARQANKSGGFHEHRHAEQFDQCAGDGGGSNGLACLPGGGNEKTRRGGLKRDG